MNWVHRQIVYALVIFSSLTVLLFYLTPSSQAHLEIDSAGYERLATHFAHTSELVDPLTPTHHPIQTLAYPFFLGMIYKIFGHSYAWVIFMQWLLSILCGLMIFSIAQRLVDTKTGLIALFLWSINLGFLVYVQFLLTEMLLVTFLLAFLERFFSFWYTKKMSTLFVACIFLGCSVVVKPAALFFIIPVVVLLAAMRLRSAVTHHERKIRSSRVPYEALRRRVYRGTIPYLLCAVLAFAIPVVGYMASNKVRFGHFAIAPMTNEILYRYFAAKIKAQLEHKKYEEVLVQEQWCADKDLLNNDGWRVSKQFLLQSVREHPWTVFSLWMSNVIKTWLGLFTTQLKVLLDPSVKGGDCSFFKMSGNTTMMCAYQYITFGQSPMLGAVAAGELLFMVLRYLAVMIAFFGLIQKKKYFLFIFCAGYCAYFTLVTGHDGCCRYRMMIEPLLIIMTAIGIDTFLKICGMLRKIPSGIMKFF